MSIALLGRTMKHLQPTGSEQKPVDAEMEAAPLTHSNTRHLDTRIHKLRNHGTGLAQLGEFVQMTVVSYQAFQRF